MSHSPNSLIHLAPGVGVARCGHDTRSHVSHIHWLLDGLLAVFVQRHVVAVKTPECRE